MADEDNTGFDVKIDDSLSTKVTRGALWVTAASILTRVLSIISGIILARILMPADFGLMAIAMSIITFSQSTTSTGFNSALIQKQDRTEDFLNTAWTFDLARHLVLFIIIFIAAPLVASFFNEPRAISVLRVISLSLVLQGLKNIGVIYFRKNLNFKKQFVLDIVPLAIYIFTVVLLAFYLRNVWALVFGNLASMLTICLVSYIMHPYRPRLDFNITKAINLFKFGKWVLGLSLLVMIREQGMTMIVGKFFGIPLLGFFNRAGAFSTLILTQISDIVWKVGFPAYSKLQLYPDKFKRSYLMTLQLLTFIGIPIAGGLFILSWDFVHLFLTDKWLPVVPLMQILCLHSILNLISVPAAVTFTALGRPSIETKITLIGIIVLIIIFYPLSSIWGITGAVASLLLTSIITSPIHWYMLLKITSVTFAESFKPVLIALINTSIMVFAIAILKQYIFDQVYIPEFFLIIFIGTVIYLVFAGLFDKFMNYGIFKLIKMQAEAVL